MTGPELEGWRTGKIRDVVLQDVERTSNFKPGEKEANFWPVAPVEVRGGSHIAVEVVSITTDGEFIMTVWPNGLPGHETDRTVRFPHGLMRFGESIRETCERLVSEQLGMSVDEVRVVDLDSYVDDDEHWHLEPHVVAFVTGDPSPPGAAEGTMRFRGLAKPEESVWSDDGFRRLVENLRQHGCKV